MNTKSFRIKSINCGTAQVWPISRNMYYVHWEEYNGLRDVSIDVGVAHRNLQSGVWTKIEEAPSEESLPRTFKFKVAGCTEHDDIAYTYVESECDCNVFWDNHKVRYGVQEIREYIAEGDWVVLPSVPEKPLDKLAVKIDTKDLINNYLEQSSDFLSIVKEFTVDSGHCVFINNGRYELYRDNEDVPYICKDEKDLLAAVNALSVLDGLDSGV